RFTGGKMVDRAHHQPRHAAAEFVGTIGRVHRMIPAKWINTRNAPTARMKMLRPTGEPQPDQVSAFSAYFHSSASGRWIVLMALLLWTKEIRCRTPSGRRLSSRSVGWQI